MWHFNDGIILLKLLFVNGSRGEWGYLRPVIRECQNRGIKYSICATNMVLLPGYGSLIDEIKAEGFNVGDEIFMSLEGHNYYSMAKSLAIFMASFVDVLQRVKPTWVVLAGDRGEQLMSAIAAAYTYIPVAHIQAGERSGNIDGVTRHAIGKFVNIHLAANQDASDRLLHLGEEAFRVHMVGAPQLDELVGAEVSSREELASRHAVDVNEKYLLVVQHPVTEEMDRARGQVNELVQALRQINMPKVWILPNNDAGSGVIRQVLVEQRTSDIRLYENLTRREYLGFMKYCACMVGNSSSGLIEAPTFKTPVVNLGRRQADRIRAENVIDAPFERARIKAGIERGLSVEFQTSLANCVNPYGDGQSAARILEILSRTKINDRLLIKQITV
jgi:GDP/UDP-N,N'-diacetylbacillosamine 2-epimerase (hydrolysing)